MNPSFNAFRCSRCGLDGHSPADCRAILRLPRQTPSHNGAYQGSLPVRVVPFGKFGAPGKK